MSSKSQTHPNISHDPSRISDAGQTFVPELSDESNTLLTLSEFRFQTLSNMGSLQYPRRQARQKIVQQLQGQ